MKADLKLQHKSLSGSSTAERKAATARVGRQTLQESLHNLAECRPQSDKPGARVCESLKRISRSASQAKPDHTAMKPCLVQSAGGRADSDLACKGFSWRKAAVALSSNLNTHTHTRQMYTLTTAKLPDDKGTRRTNWWQKAQLQKSVALLFPEVSRA